MTSATFDRATTGASPMTQGMLDVGRLPELNRLTRLIAHHFNASAVAVVLADADHCRVASSAGLPPGAALDECKLCRQAVFAQKPLVVTGTMAPCGTNDHCEPIHDSARFFAGHAVRSRHGSPIGALCIFDTNPRDMNPHELADLQDFAATVELCLQGFEAHWRADAAEKHLYDADTQFEQMFLHANIGIALVSLEGRWLRVNQRLCAIVGYDEPTLLTKTFQDITHPDDLDADLNLVRQILAGDIATYSMEKRYFRGDGTIVWVELTVALMRDVRGQPWQFISVVNDISARKRAEADLAALHNELEGRVAQRTDELNIVIKQLNHQIERRVDIQQTLVAERERFYSTLENAPDAFVQLDMRGQVTAWNLAAERLFGWDRKDVVGREFAELAVPEPDREALRSDFQRVVRHGTPTASDFRVEISAMRRDGGVFPAELKLGESRSGDVRLIDVFLQDITRRKAAESALLASKERLATITDNLPALIAYVGADLRYQFNNRTYLDWFGKSPEALSGTLLTEFVAEHSSKKVDRHIARALSGQRATYEKVLRSIHGEMWVQTTFVPDVTDEGKVDGFYVLSQDITDRKALEQRLVYEVTHDTLTALPNRRAFLRTIVDAAKRARRSGQGMALLYLDLDGFKQLNDVHGHEFGDRVLQHFAATLSSTVRETDTVCRLAGDEFTVVLETLADPEAGSIRVAEKILERLRQTTVIDGVTVQLASSIGIASVGSGEAVVPDTLIARADAAMYRAKGAGKGRYAVN
ncbi:MAG: PAS domain S-box protein [Burkholderiales bacterium]|nr:PAS domain S-box protein [Burkholderiales bacterium]